MCAVRINCALHAFDARIKGGGFTSLISERSSWGCTRAELITPENLQDFRTIELGMCPVRINYAGEFTRLIFAHLAEGCARSELITPANLQD